MKSRIFLLLGLALVVAGCASKVNSDENATASMFVPTNSKVGQIKKSTVPNIDVAYKIANKKLHFYRSLKMFGKKSAVTADYATERGETFGATNKYVTSKGTFYHMVTYESGGFEGIHGPQTIDNFSDFADVGYVKASDMKRIKTVHDVKTYKHKRPYYVADPNIHRIWNQPPYTVHYTYISGVFDRLAAEQLYATKEVTRYNGSHYIFLERANGQKLGWTFKNSKSLVAGKYRDPGKQFLKPKKHEAMTKKVQSNRSTGNRVTTNESLSMPQRTYILRDKQHHIAKVLVTGMDNRISKINFHKGQATKLTVYTYRRKPWKTITNRKKLRTHYQAGHLFLQTDNARANFYSVKNPKLVTVITYGYDGMATTTVYRNGRVKFNTHKYKHIMTYPLSSFNFK
ncbi:hypothetical protein ACFQ44_06885 [Levilactobacillus lanxiensis]|uniref:Lipoprotein n=1 Tax=Levilactobacillus lanxiensis TaxID=2799568 RepID=A0ABW4D3T0_9LACO|nr:hypothetical protein [Levilactobacillus lanxiensis]